eukprot:TRINITY_DN903_c0_g1_i7.p3 TRINITY_DN903_c0_g1~~TRINITY_DN903_c0_g1_i7.p3  ORF type:complete len:222 (+),score=-6.65 TRINITY_DN903_c0_g1_i7:653-1318(+)
MLLFNILVFKTNNLFSKTFFDVGLEKKMQNRHKAIKVRKLVCWRCKTSYFLNFVVKRQQNMLVDMLVEKYNFYVFLLSQYLCIYVKLINQQQQIQTWTIVKPTGNRYLFFCFGIYVSILFCFMEKTPVRKLTYIFLIYQIDINNNFKEKINTALLLWLVNFIGQFLILQKIVLQTNQHHVIIQIQYLLEDLFWVEFKYFCYKQQQIYQIGQDKLLFVSTFI